MENGFNNIFQAELRGNQVVSVQSLVATLRSWLPKLTLLFTGDGLWIRSATASVACAILLNRVDYFDELAIAPPNTSLSVPVLTHELDAVLGASASSSAPVRISVRADDLSHLHVETAGDFCERAVVHVCEQHPPHASGDLLPPELEGVPQFVAPGLRSTTNTLAPKALQRALRNHRGQLVRLTYLDHSGRVMISSEYGGNPRQTELGGAGVATVSDQDEPRTYLAGMLSSLLKLYTPLDAPHFRVDRVCGPKAPLQLLGAIGHFSYVRIFLTDKTFTFDTSSSPAV